MKIITIKSFAKVNLVLDCLYKRPDDYHQVEMIMQTISLYDTIKISKCEEIKVNVDHPLVPCDQRNLAHQAALLVKEKYPQVQGVEITMDKVIPVEAGLAGGSSNGASVIMGMDKLYDLQMSKQEMLEMGRRLGSDVSFFFQGPTALAEGRGEMVTSLPDCPPLWFVLIKPDFGVKTPEIYKNLDLQQRTGQPDLKKYIKALEARDINYLCENLYNMLEKSTFNLYPQVRELKDGLEKLGSKYNLMSGSGPTVFAVFKTKDEAEDFGLKAKKALGHPILIAHTVSKDEYKGRLRESAL